MNFQTMDYFVAVAEEKSFTKAAERLSVTQQTLSANIAAAEKELGSKLLERTVPLSLTFAGEEFLRYARKFQAQRRAMDQEFLDIAGNERGRLRVGVTATRGHIIMPRSIAAFQKLHPNISIELDEGENDELVEWLSEGQLDLIVATVNSSSYDLVVKKLFDEKIVLVVSQALLESLYADKVDSVVAQVKKTGKLTALEACPFLTVGKRDIAGSFARHTFAASGISPTIKVMSRNSETLLALAMRGVGACFLPSELVASSNYDFETSGLHIIELGKEMSYSVSVAWRRTDHVWSTIESFAQVLSEQRYVVKRGE
ncbi:LysR family transcriptional regulator [Lancefieldella parvula]|uniref:LysR family transcriptional regulator n=1 Tax=Lancefieldella parvula TaxID=1382 RepID=UPI0028D3827C|nr:LysR family transcriptional regulator [Lancefieldella parvula]